MRAVPQYITARELEDRNVPTACYILHVVLLMPCRMHPMLYGVRCMVHAHDEEDRDVVKACHCDKAAECAHYGEPLGNHLHRSRSVLRRTQGSARLQDREMGEEGCTSVSSPPNSVS